MQIANAPFELNQILEPLTELYQTQCAAKGVAYETKILPPIEPWVIGDSLRLTQILNNLLSNAVKFTKQGRIWLTVRQTDVVDEKVFIRFEVSDTGCGMSEEPVSYTHLDTYYIRFHSPQNAITLYPPRKSRAIWVFLY